MAQEQQVLQESLDSALYILPTGVQWAVMVACWSRLAELDVAKGPFSLHGGIHVASARHEMFTNATEESFRAGDACNYNTA